MAHAVRINYENGQPPPDDSESIVTNFKQVCRVCVEFRGGNFITHFTSTTLFQNI